MASFSAYHYHHALFWVGPTSKLGTGSGMAAAALAWADSRCPAGGRAPPRRAEGKYRTGGATGRRRDPFGGVTAILMPEAADFAYGSNRQTDHNTAIKTAMKTTSFAYS
jgi:hypothetical protein